ncbi:MAG: TolC family protein [Candidatus Aminicenantes bacterium]|nr:TolC family protein [Candidatus Aminicenantes bacterium]MDH5706121.1 TolC family protein [Candidatus Aminicenantes bacterium]
MLKYKNALCFVFIFFLFAGLHAQEKKISLTLEECITKSMRNNLNVAVEVLNPELADISISLAREKFLPTLTFDYYLQDREEPSFSLIEVAGSVQADYTDYIGRIRQLIPTGADFSISLYSYRRESNLRYQTYNPRYTSILSFDFTQPLLKNFGFKMSRREIIVAKNSMEISENQFKGILMDTVYEVESAYWSLVFSLEDLNAKKQSLEWARNFLAKNKREVEVGTLAPIEILSAESEVATREADILQAEAEVKNREDQLKTMINLASEEGGMDAEVMPVDKPDFTKKEVSLEEALEMALQNRPDLYGIRADINNKKINLTYAKNQLLPELNLIASYWSPGISGTELLYDPNDPLGDPIGSLPGGAMDSFKDAFNFKFRNWSVRLTLNVPLNTMFSRAQQAQARTELDQSRLRFKNQEQQVILEVKNAVRAVETNYKRFQAYMAARKLAEKALEAEEKKLKVGLTTHYTVLQYQRDLANTISGELRAVIDYNLSLAQLDKVMGVSLKNKNIKFSIFE